MLDLQRVRQLLNDPNISDDTALEIRDNFRLLAEIIFEKWEKENINIKSQKNETGI